MTNSVQVSPELLCQVDLLVEYLGFGSRRAFVDAAIRRLLDHYALTLPRRPTRPTVVTRPRTIR